MIVSLEPPMALLQMCYHELEVKMHGMLLAKDLSRTVQPVKAQAWQVVLARKVSRSRQMALLSSSGAYWLLRMIWLMLILMRRRSEVR